jgi:hypothetical protein
MQNFVFFSYFFVDFHPGDLQNTHKDCVLRLNQAILLEPLNMEVNTNGKEKSRSKERQERKRNAGRRQQSQSLCQKQRHDDFFGSNPALNDCIYAMLDAALARTQANKRSTLKPQDM